MLRTFYSDEVLLNDAELLYGLLSACVNKGLTDAIVQSLTMFVSANKRLLSKTVATSVAAGLKTNIKNTVGDIAYAVEQFETNWLTHPAWKLDIADHLSRSHAKLDDELELAKSEF